MEANNMKAMREALEDARNFLLKHCCGSSEAQAIISRIDCALAAPPRNCDVGTAKEQEVRFDGFCMAHKEIKEPGLKVCSDNCPFVKKGFCDLHWAQMPYEKDGGKLGVGTQKVRSDFWVPEQAVTEGGAK